MDVMTDNFISFCDQMIIAEEGFIDSIKSKIKRVLLKIIRFLKSKVFKNEYGRIHGLLARAEMYLSDVDNVQTPDEVNDLQYKVDELEKEVTNLKEENESLKNELNSLKSHKDESKHMIVTQDINKQYESLSESNRKCLISIIRNINKYNSLSDIPQSELSDDIDGLYNYLRHCIIENKNPQDFVKLRIMLDSLVSVSKEFTYFNVSLDEEVDRDSMFTTNSSYYGTGTRVAKMLLPGLQYNQNAIKYKALVVSEDIFNKRIKKD